MPARTPQIAHEGAIGDDDDEPTVLTLSTRLSATTAKLSMFPMQRRMLVPIAPPARLTVTADTTGTTHKTISAANTIIVEALNRLGHDYIWVPKNMMSSLL